MCVACVRRNCSLPQIIEYKKKLEDESGIQEAFEEGKKKMLKEMDVIQERVDVLTSENDKLSKSKKKLQAEVQ